MLKDYFLCMAFVFLMGWWLLLFNGKRRILRYGWKPILIALLCTTIAWPVGFVIFIVAMLKME